MSTRIPQTVFLQATLPHTFSVLLVKGTLPLASLTLPQTDGPDDGLPQGGERSEQFVLEVSEYFERLDVGPFSWTTVYLTLIILLC